MVGSLLGGSLVAGEARKESFRWFTQRWMKELGPLAHREGYRGPQEEIDPERVEELFGHSAISSPSSGVFDLLLHLH